jgi:predicted metal-dependent enzyme (double-stranded beta helix superfamily)
MTHALRSLVAAVEAALIDDSLPTDRAKAEAMKPAMAALLASDEPIPPSGRESLDGDAVGNLLYADPAGRFHVLAVVFPEGTSSGVHHHGCWGVIGYLQGGDEETRYACARDDGGTAELSEASRHIWHQGDVTYLLPDEGEGWHRVRNPGPGDGVSVHVLCKTPADHPHRYWDRKTNAVHDFPFIEVTTDRWQARVATAGD